MSTAADPVAPDHGAGGGAPAIELRGIGKRFPGVIANHDVDITIRAGSIHALVGENGAGKSTLMKILYGVQRPDEGTVVVDGTTVTLSTPADAIAAGVGMVFQHFMLADNLSVLENVVLGAERVHGIGEEAAAAITEISSRFGFGLDPHELVETLGVGERQRVEILKVLYRGARIIILDEPTAVLVPQEVDALFENLRQLKEQGHTLIFISHKLDEVRAVADDITVMRRGTTVASVRPEDVTSRELAELMVGSELPSPSTEASTVSDRVLLSVSGVEVLDATGRAELSDIDLEIHAGEVLGIAGVEGNGQTELVETLIGMRQAHRGTITLHTADGPEDITGWTTRDRRAAGIGYVPEDRQRHGLLLDAPLWENRILGHQTRPPVVHGVWLDRGGARGDATRIVEEYDVRTPGIDTSAAALSGGNQQKFIVGREMSDDPVLLVASHPTRGVDVGAQAQIWDHVREARRRGLAVLLVSADLDELIGLSDTIRVLLRGRLVGTFDPQVVTPQDLGSAHDRGGGRLVRGGSRLRRALLGAAAPVLALVAAAVVATLVLVVTGDDIGAFWSTLLQWPEHRNLVAIMNQTAILYLSGVAAAIGFRMNLFNIGVEGQYRIAGFAAGAFAGAGWLPGYLNTVAAVVVAMLTGALWAGIAGILRVTRGVSEVISTIMLNAIAGSLIGYFITRVGVSNGKTTNTATIPESSWVGNVPVFSDSPTEIYGLSLLAVVVGVGFWLLLNRTRFGFDLRASGSSETAAVASGVDVRRMVVYSMLLSGAVAALVGLPVMFSESHNYGSSFQTGLGFTGIAVALLGRNYPAGIAFGALIFAFLSQQATLLNILAGVSPDIISVTQGVIVMAVVLAYEVVSRYRVRTEQAEAADHEDRPSSPRPEAEGASA